jgi:hypothetical protein
VAGFFYGAFLWGYFVWPLGFLSTEALFINALLLKPFFCGFCGGLFCESLRKLYQAHA